MTLLTQVFAAAPMVSIVVMAATLIVVVVGLTGLVGLWLHQLQRLIEHPVLPPSH